MNGEGNESRRARNSQVVTPKGVHRTQSAIDWYSDLLGPERFGSQISVGSADDRFDEKAEDDSAVLPFVCADFAERAGLLHESDLRKFQSYGGDTLLARATKKYEGVVTECCAFALAQMTSFSEFSKSVSDTLRKEDCAEELCALCSKQYVNSEDFDEGSVRSALVTLTNMCAHIGDNENAKTCSTLSALTNRLGDFKYLLELNARKDEDSMVYDHTSLMFGAVLHLISVLSKFDTATEAMFREDVFAVACHLSDSATDNFTLECCAIILGNMLSSESSVRTTSESLGADAEEAYNTLSRKLGEDSAACSQLRLHIDRLEEARNEYRKTLKHVGHVVTQPRVLVLHTLRSKRSPESRGDRKEASTIPPPFTSSRPFDMTSAIRNALRWVEADESYVAKTKCIVDKASVFDSSLDALSVKEKLISFFDYEGEPLIILQCSITTDPKTGDWIFVNHERISFIDIMVLWVNSKAKKSGSVLLIVAVGDHSGALVEQANRTKVSQLVVHTSCKSFEECSLESFFRCFSTLQREGESSVHRIVSHLHSQNMHPQLYASSDVRERSLSQTNIQLIQDENGFAVLMMGLLRGCMIRLLAKTAPPGC